jgi:glutamate dehydrogenase
VRDRVRDLVAQRYGADGVDVHEVLGENDRMQVHLIAYAADGLKEVSTSDLQAEVRELARSWDDRLREELCGNVGEERGPHARRPLGAAAARAVQGVAAAGRGRRGRRVPREARDRRSDLVVGLSNNVSEPTTSVSLYKRGPKIELGRATPLLEHLGAARDRGAADARGGRAGAMGAIVHGPRARRRAAGPRAHRRAGCRDAARGLARRVGIGLAQSADRPDRTSAGSRSRSCARTGAIRQRIGSRYTESFQNDVIAANPRLTEKLMRLFELRFDPAKRGTLDTCTALRNEIAEDLDAVELLDHDRILRNQLG